MGLHWPIRVFVEIDDPSIDLIVPVVSQMHSEVIEMDNFTDQPVNKIQELLMALTKVTIL